nr:Cyclic nucleotide-binding domain-containing protein 2 [Polyrhizophydium stewartii]
MPSFARFTHNQKLQFCEIMQYQRLPKARPRFAPQGFMELLADHRVRSYAQETLIVKEGHVSWAFYFILNGQVEIYKIKDNSKHRLNILNSGDSFGDRTMNTLNDKRTACVGTTIDTELLIIDKSDFFRIANTTDEHNITSKIAQLSAVPMLAISDSGFLEKAAYFFRKVRYEPNEAILLEGTESTDLFWILKGTCRCVKLVPFVQKKTRLGFSAVKSHMRAHNASVPLGDDEELVEQLLSIQELQASDCFPDMPMSSARLDQWLTESMFDKERYIDFLVNIDPTSPSSKAYVSVIANTRVEVVAIPRVDFCRLASVRMLLNLLLNQGFRRTPIEQLQHAFLEHRNWQIFKRRVVSEIIRK